MAEQHDKNLPLLAEYFKSKGYGIEQINTAASFSPDVEGQIPDIIMKKDDKRIAVEWGNMNNKVEKINKLLKIYNVIYHIPRDEVLTFVYVYDPTILSSTALDEVKQNMEKRYRSNINSLKQMILQQNQEIRELYSIFADFFNSTISTKNLIYNKMMRLNGYKEYIERMGNE